MSGGSPGGHFAPGARAAATRLVALRWPYSPSLLDIGWAVFSALNLVAMYWFAYWETIPFHFIWISLTLVYGFRAWRSGPTMWVLGAVMVTTASGIGLDVWRGTEPPEELTEVPLMAAVFAAMVWHAHRKQEAERSHRIISEQNARLVADQRQFLQDAAHQLRTPITIALGHAELLASNLTGQQESQDIHVVIGELDRLRRISERLLLIAAAADPEFLHAEPVALDQLTMELLRRWRPTADRRWRVGRLDRVTVRADRERLSLALDALLENAVRHTGTGDVIQLSVIRGWPGRPVRIIVADGGGGIAADQLDHIFDRFRTGGDSQSRGTGLGLPLVRAVARAHGGDVTVKSRPGEGSEFELTLPEPASSRAGLPAGPDGSSRPRGQAPAALLAPGRTPPEPPGTSPRDQQASGAVVSRGQGQLAGWAVPTQKRSQAMSSLDGAAKHGVAALRGAGRLAGQHKIATAVGALFAAAIVTISLISSQSSSGSPHSDPVAPSFTVTALGKPGQHVSLSQYKDKPLIVNFWASWCPPCQQETPLLARWYKAQNGHVNLVGLDENDTTASALKFARAKGVSYPLGFDPGPALVTASAYGVVALPQTFFLNAQHRIVDRIYGAVTQADLATGVRLMDAKGP